MTDKRRWYVMDPDDGLTEYDTAEDAHSACVAAMQSFVDNANDDGWPEDMGALEWGELVASAGATRTSCEPAPDGSDFDMMETWELLTIRSGDADADADARRIERALIHLVGVIDSESPMSLHARITAARAELE